jgi:hypothetical protein
MRLAIPGKEMGRTLLNVTLFQATWFAAVLGTAAGMPWLGPGVVALTLTVHLAVAEDRRGEIRLLMAAGVLGFLYDTALIAAGVFSPLQHLTAPPWSSPWMVGLWLNFAATLNVSLAWLKGRYPLAALFGAIGGPLAYYGGAKLGATEALPTMSGLLVLTIGWGTMTPLLVWLAHRLRSLPPDQAGAIP